MEVDDDLSIALDTETFAERDMVLPSFAADTLDTYSLPTMSAECERVFNSVKKLITLERNVLAGDTY